MVKLRLACRVDNNECTTLAVPFVMCFPCVAYGCQVKIGLCALAGSVKGEG